MLWTIGEKKQPANKCWWDHKIQIVSVGGIYSHAGEILNFHNIEADNLEEDGIFFPSTPLYK